MGNFLKYMRAGDQKHIGMAFFMVLLFPCLHLAIPTFKTALLTMQTYGHEERIEKEIMIKATDDLQPIEQNQHN